MAGISLAQYTMTAPRKVVSVKKGREWQVLRGHPWLFSGSISQAPARVEPGDTVELLDCDGKFVARGYYNPACDIAVRILTLDPDEQIDRSFVRRRVLKAINLRKRVIDRQRTNVYRLVNAEGDFLPGLIADVFDDVIVVQSHTAGGDRLLEPFIGTLVAELNPRSIILRNDASVRKREGLSIEAPHIVQGRDAEPVIVKENDLLFKVDPLQGQKTGFFTDQRDKRAAVAKYCSQLPPDSVLANCFSYSAAFSVYASKTNQSLKTINIDQSGNALELARNNFEINGLKTDGHEFLEEDVFSYLESAVRANRKFEFVILDPPAFAKKQKDQKNALRAYTKLNRLGIECCAPDAFLLTCSCSGIITLDDLEECVNTAAAQASRQVQILEVFKHGADHPINIAAPESEYLKVILCRVI